jgi:Tol biopolymer transport system component
VTKQGIKLLDFGLAKQTGALKETDVTKALTSQGEIVGTLQYMSPEQLQGKEVDPRSDLFSFGCVLYEMLTGKRAFEGQSAASLIAAIIERDPAPLTIAPALERIVRRSLAKDPDQRFQTARDLKAALHWAMEHQPAPAPVRHWHWPATAALVMLAALAGWGVAHFRQPVADDRVVTLQIDPPEGARFVFGSNTGGLALSPDGKTAAYVVSNNGKNALWVRALDSTTARLLPGTEEASYPFWSPDSRSIAFFTTGKLKRVDLAGGSPLTICDSGVARGGAWSSDGQILFASLVSGLRQVPASGGTPSLLTAPDAYRGEAIILWPQLLPGGRFLYFLRSGNSQTEGVYAGSLAKPAERTRLLATDAAALYAPEGDGKGCLLWLRGATLLAQEFNPGTLKLSGTPHPVADPVSRNLTGVNATVSASGLLLYSDSNPSGQFIWTDHSGKAHGMVGEPGDYTAFQLSPDGRRAAVTRGLDLWLLEVDRGVSSRFTSSEAVSGYPIWSPDGRTIVFRTAKSLTLFRKDSNGSGSEQRIAQSPNIQIPSDWSRDGRFILYDQTTRQRDLWILPVTPDGTPAADAQPKLYLRTPYNEWRGRFSPEASPHWVAYQADESGRNEIYIQSFPEPHGPTRISIGGGQYPAWNPNGRELFYVSPDNKLMAVSLKLAADSVEPSPPRELFPLPADEIGYSPYEVAPDGQRFLVRAATQQAAQPLTLIVNWPALLKRTTPSPQLPMQLVAIRRTNRPKAAPMGRLNSFTMSTRFRTPTWRRGRFAVFPELKPAPADTGTSMLPSSTNCGGWCRWASDIAQR